MVPTTVRPPTALVNNTWLVPWVLPQFSPPRMTWLPTAPPGETAPFTAPRNGGWTKPPLVQATPRPMIATTGRVRRCDAIRTPRDRRWLTKITRIRRVGDGPLLH